MLVAAGGVVVAIVAIVVVLFVRKRKVRKERKGEPEIDVLAEGGRMSRVGSVRAGRMSRAGLVRAESIRASLLNDEEIAKRSEVLDD